jgi:hypothetical protein
MKGFDAAERAYERQLPDDTKDADEEDEDDDESPKEKRRLKEDEDEPSRRIYEASVPQKGQFGLGLNEEAMKMLKQYDIYPNDLYEYDDPDTHYKDIYTGIQAAKQGNNAALQTALETTFGKNKFWQKVLSATPEITKEAQAAQFQMGLYWDRIKKKQDAGLTPGQAVMAVLSEMEKDGDKIVVQAQVYKNPYPKGSDKAGLWDHIINKKYTDPSIKGLDGACLKIAMKKWESVLAGYMGKHNNLTKQMAEHAIVKNLRNDPNRIADYLSDEVSRDNPNLEEKQIQIIRKYLYAKLTGNGEKEIWMVC